VRRAALAALLLAACAPAFAELSEFEGRIVAAVKSRSAEAIRFLEKTVHVNSGTLNTDGSARGRPPLRGGARAARLPHALGSSCRRR
jgi:hypothetical protein